MLDVIGICDHRCECRGCECRRYGIGRTQVAFWIRQAPGEHGREAMQIPRGRAQGRARGIGRGLRIVPIREQGLLNLRDLEQGLDQLNRLELPSRTRAYQQKYPVELEFGIKDGGVSFARGVSDGQRFLALLQDLTAHVPPQSLRLPRFLLHFGEVFFPFGKESFPGFRPLRIPERCNYARLIPLYPPNLQDAGALFLTLFAIAPETSYLARGL